MGVTLSASTGWSIAGPLSLRLALLILIVFSFTLTASPSAWMAATAAHTSYQDYLYAWGHNQGGQTGSGIVSDDEYSTPKIINQTIPRDWDFIASGVDYACGISNGVAYCWGSNSNGKLGRGNTSATGQGDVPTAVAGGITGWTRISLGTDHTCGIANGIAYCWGLNTSGSLGRGNATATAATTPSIVLGGWTDWTEIAAGDDYSCGINSGGVLYCWGESASGRLGNGNASTDRTSPSIVSGGYTNWTNITVSIDTTCGIAGGTAYCWGENGNGEVGDNATIDRTTPTLQSGTSGWTWSDITMGADYGCAVRSDSPNEGRLYCWGNNSWGRKSTNTNNKYPEEAKANNGSGGAYTGWTKVSARTDHTCGIRNSGLYCWGNQAKGKLGDGTSSTFGQGNNLANLVNLSNSDYTWTQVAVGKDNSYGIRRDRNINTSTGAAGLGTNRSTLGPPGGP